MKKNLFIVEGYHDVMRFKQAVPEINVVSINGSAHDQNIDFIVKSKNDYNIILCFDPDHAGLKLRTYFEKLLEDVHHLYIPPELSKSKNNKKIGFEHVDLKYLKELLNNYQISTNTNTSDVTTVFLFENKLIGNKNSKERRLFLSNYFPIGYTNSKSLLNKLHLLGITKKEILEVLT